MSSNKKKHRHSSSTHSSRPPGKSQRPSTSLQKTEIIINVYDLLPPGRLSSALWFLGSSLLHTGVVIKALGREYAFGGHDRANVSGVYWTKPHMEPPGGTWRCEILQGFTFQTVSEIEAVVKEVSQEFQGPSYNLLSNNCNHFTSFLCRRLTGKPAPGWLNRAASIGVALPCVVPREWIAPPDADTADGALLDEDDEDERTSMLREDYRRTRAQSFHGSHVGSEDDGWDSEGDRRIGGNGKGKGKGKGALRDTDGRDLPASERAPA